MGRTLGEVVGEQGVAECIRVWKVGGNWSRRVTK
jgi:hypothetical protein